MTKKADEAVTAGEEVVERASALKKAGLPTAGVILVTVLSIPGVWKFFDRTDQEAKVKAEVAYQLLKAQAEAQAKQIDATSAAVGELRDLVNQLLLQRSAAGLGHQVRFDAVQVLTESMAEPAPLPSNLDQAAAAALAKE